MKESPRCLDDFWVLNFLRCYSDCIVTTGQILRDEPYAFDPSLAEKLKLPKAVYFKDQKTVCVLTNKLSNNILDSNPLLYQNKKLKKIILSNSAALKRFQEFGSTSQFPSHISSHGLENLSLRSGLQFLKELNHQMILIECGPSTTIPCYSKTHNIAKESLDRAALDYKCDGNPIDTLVLSMFVGSLSTEN